MVDLSHFDDANPAIVTPDLKLVEKTGGNSDF